MTDQDFEEFRIFITQLQKEECRPTALNELKNFLTFQPAALASRAIRNIGISKIVRCLTVSDKAQFELTCEVLQICFNKCEPGYVIKMYTSHIMYLLRHDKSCVRHLAITEIYKAVTVDCQILPISQYIDVFVAVAHLVSDSDISISNKAVIITSNLPFEAYPKILDEMKIGLDHGVSSKCNVFEVIINISLKSYEMFEVSAAQGYIDAMISDLDSNDVLYQLNILELLSRLAVKPYGIVYLVKQGALKKICEFMLDLPNNPLGGLLTPGYMKFFGCLAHFYPREIFNNYSTLIDALFDMLDNGEPTILPVLLDTLGFIGCTIEGKLCLAAVGSKYTLAVEELGRTIKNSTNEIKVRALHCYASLISIDKDPNVLKTGPVDHRVTLMTREWFRSLSASPSSIDYLFEVCKNPFPDIRLAAFTFLDAVCQHQWGEELVARTAGFIEYLLDRSVDHTKESKEAKYDVIKRLSNSAAFEPAIISRLNTYVEQGPFYIESALEVAMEGD